MKSCVAAFAALCACAAALHAAPLEAYGRLPTLSKMTLSPDGATIAYVKGVEDKRFIVVQTIGVQKPLDVINVGDNKLRSIQWADNTHLLITTSMTTLPAGLIGRRSEYATAQWLDIRTKELHSFLDQRDSLGGFQPDVPRMNVVEGEPEPRVIDGHTYVFVRGIYFPGTQSRYALFRVDMTSGKTEMVSRDGDTHAENWVVDKDGNIVAEEDYFEAEKRWKLNLYHDGYPSTAVDVPAAIEGPGIEGLTEDGSAVLVSVPQNEGTPLYEEISLKDGKSSAWQHADLHLGDLFDDERTGRVIGGPRTTDKDDYVFFDRHADEVWRSIKAAFTGAFNVDLVSWSDDWTKVIVRVFGTGYGDGYFYVNMTTLKAEPIGPAYDGIDQVAPVKWIDYRAGDGRVIHAYLTLPLNREPKDLPLVVVPHGGPHARDEPGFDWISQAIASRGYVVLQPEFRGSDGFGRELLWAGFGEFGKKMQTDLSDGVSALAAQGLIDPKRVCIVGASYGGYAALAGATLQSGIYRCAVSIAGLSDLRGQLEHWHWPRNKLDDRSERFWDRFLAVDSPDDPKLDAISPIKHVANVSIPILLIHGRDDTVVPFAQSDDMADALKDAGKKVEFVKLDGEDHWLSRSDTRLQMLEATVKFLEANNPPK